MRLDDETDSIVKTDSIPKKLAKQITKTKTTTIKELALTSVTIWFRVSLVT